MTIEDTMARVQAESDLRSMHFAAQQLRKYLATALCCHCGEPLGEGEITQSEDGERTLHMGCLETDGEDTK